MLRDHPKWRAVRETVTGILSHAVGPVIFEWIVILWLSLLPRGVRSRVTDENRS